jgi:hypothetical protein
VSTQKNSSVQNQIFVNFGTVVLGRTQKKGNPMKTRILGLLGFGLLAAATTASSSVTYRLTAGSDNFVYVSADFIEGVTAVPASSLLSCSTQSGFVCSGIQFDPDIFDEYDTVVFSKLDSSSNSSINYTFANNAFTTLGTYYDGSFVLTVTESEPTELLEVLLIQVSAIDKVGKKLSKEVVLAQTYYAAQDAVSACVVMADFQAQVAALAGKNRKLTDAQAQALSTGAMNVIIAIGCD